MGLPSGDCTGVGLFSRPQPHTPDLIPDGAQAAEPLLPQQPADWAGLRVKVKNNAHHNQLLLLKPKSFFHLFKMFLPFFICHQFPLALLSLCQPPCVPQSVVLSSGAEPGDDVAVLNGCQEDHKSSSAKVQHKLRVRSDSTSALVKRPLKHMSLKPLNNHAPCPPSLHPFPFHY